MVRKSRPLVALAATVAVAGVSAPAPGQDVAAEAPAGAGSGAGEQRAIGPDYGVFGPFALETSTPEYPEAAARDCIAGYVLVQLDVMVDGTASNVAVLQSEPAGLFEQAAIDAIAGWAFAPRRVDGVLAPARVQQVFAFRPPPPCPQIDQSGEQLEKCRAETPERYGVVSLDLTLNADGTPASIEVASSTHEFMNEGVVETARGWQYEPGEAGRRLLDQKVEFCLREDAVGR